MRREKHDQRSIFKQPKHCVSLNTVIRTLNIQLTRGKVKATQSNQMHTQGTHGNTQAYTSSNPNNLQTPELQSPVVFSDEIPMTPTKKFPEINKTGTIRIVLPHRFQICNQFNLIHPIFSRSKQKKIEIKTYSSSYMLNSQPFSNLIISTSSTKHDLHIYIMKSAKGDDEYCITWKCSSLFTRSQEP